MDYLRFYVLFNSSSGISGRWTDGKERLCAMEPRLRLRRYRLERGSSLGPLDQLASSLPTELSWAPNYKRSKSAIYNLSFLLCEINS